MESGVGYNWLEGKIEETGRVYSKKTFLDECKIRKIKTSGSDKKTKGTLELQKALAAYYEKAPHLELDLYCFQSAAVQAVTTARMREKKSSSKGMSETVAEVPTEIVTLSEIAPLSVAKSKAKITDYFRK